MELIDGKKIAADIRTEIAATVVELGKSGARRPHLAAILVGDDPASSIYVGGKEKACKEVGFDGSVYRYPASTTEAELLTAVGFLNNDPDIDGFIVQLPLPAHINAQNVIRAINPAKDVDGFHPVNIGKMTLNLPSYLPATPFGILELLKRSNVETEGKNCVVLGRSNIVGMPISILLARNSKLGNCTVTICHSRTKDIGLVTREADILIAAVGKPHFVTEEMVKPGAVVIDVGIHRIPDPKSKTGNRIVGDVDFENVANKCSMITPVPVGVGPMTITALLLNTLSAFRKDFD
ncbi:MAG: bifunctional 5,10-methylenetetrahydrofolate dehydrogenase/5,10-methenyltetrahydrofolate cyclohydrolase [Bacteroidetes bacterium]|nr:bifunctional 5,10-methylenetetrahydrofolate dehydrogenase/5,10-methenyltetrahydrofolate cyclohydrolase [Bacteroidota bacterium]